MNPLENSISTHVGRREGKGREARGRQSDHKLRRLGQCPRCNTLAARRNQQGLGGLLGASGRPQQSSLHWPGQAERCSLPPVTAIFLPPGKTTPTIGHEAEARRAWSLGTILLTGRGRSKKSLVPLGRILLTGTKHCPPFHSCKYDQRPQLFHSPESITDSGLCKAVNRQEKLSTFTTRETAIFKTEVVVHAYSPGTWEPGALGSRDSRAA